MIPKRLYFYSTFNILLLYYSPYNCSHLTKTYYIIVLKSGPANSAKNLSHFSPPIGLEVPTRQYYDFCTSRYLGTYNVIIIHLLECNFCRILLISNFVKDIFFCFYYLWIFPLSLNLFVLYIYFAFTFRLFIYLLFIFIYFLLYSGCLSPNNLVNIFRVYF